VVASLGFPRCQNPHVPLHTASSPHDVKATTDRLVTAAEGRGLTVFSRVDHGGGARSAGLPLGDAEVVSFGDPKVGSVLMQADLTVGYELPLRILVWQAPARPHGEAAGEVAAGEMAEDDGQAEGLQGGATLVSYRPATELSRHYQLEGLTEILERMDRLLEALVHEAVTPA
jgi:Domain of unknown function DUF302